MAQISQLQPKSQPFIQQLTIGNSQFPNNFQHEPLFNSRQLSFDSAGNVQPGSAPFL